jgi:hypothetical protein
LGAGIVCERDPLTAGEFDHLFDDAGEHVPRFGQFRMSPSGRRVTAVIPAVAQMKANFVHKTIRMSPAMSASTLASCLHPYPD